MAAHRRRTANTSGFLPVFGNRIQNSFIVSMFQLSSLASFITIVLGLISNLAVDAAPLILFEDSQFRGIRTEYKLDGIETCLNIRGKLNDFFSSVQNPASNSCYLLCEHEYCRGRCVQITASVENLTHMDFNDMVSSIQRCPTPTLTATTTFETSTETTTTSTTTEGPQAETTTVPSRRRSSSSGTGSVNVNPTSN